MSNTLTGTGGTPSLSGLSDDSMATHHTFACLFATRAEAERAQAALIADGIASSDIQLIDRGVSGTTTANPLAPSYDEGFWGSLKRLFTGDEDVAGYGEGITRGHALLSVTTTAAKADHVADTLERFNPIDLDAQEATWRKEGWTGTMGTGAAPAAMASTARTDAAMLTGTAPTGTVNDKGEQVFQTVEGRASRRQARRVARQRAGSLVRRLASNHGKRFAPPGARHDRAPSGERHGRDWRGRVS